MASSSAVLPHTYVALRLQSGTHKILKVIPDTVISLGKYGSFLADQIIARPYYLTFEILDREEDQEYPGLRIVPASELHEEILADDTRLQSESKDEAGYEDDGIDSFDVVGPSDDLLMRNNRLTIDDPSRQALTMEEIETLKKEVPGSGKEIIAKIMQSHTALDEKTAFSLAKYALRKSKKYLRRFTVLPLDLSKLAAWMLYEKEPARIMEVREEMLGLISSWANIHFTPSSDPSEPPSGRWLVVDDTGGLMIAALAERMDILYPSEPDPPDKGGESAVSDPPEVPDDRDLADTQDGPAENGIKESADNSTPAMLDRTQLPPRLKRHPPDAMTAMHNTLTVLHSATQPNISMLSYFGYNPSDTSVTEPYPAFKHPLHTHLKSVSWLQLLSPELDGAYTEPGLVDAETLSTWKTSKRGNYYRKRRRWECAKRVVDETRAGGFDGLVVASAMDPTSILHHTVPLLRGGAQVAVYNPAVEPLVELMDMYSSSRRTAYINLRKDSESKEAVCSSEDFPVDPRLLLAPTLQTARATEWQVLPGRTHPLMTGRGGAEGYLFTAIRVLPFEGAVEARGRFTKKRKTAEPNSAVGSD